MKVFCSTGKKNTEGSIFQCSMMTRLSLGGTSNGLMESTALRSRLHITSSNNCSQRNEKKFAGCENNNVTDIIHGTLKKDSISNSSSNGYHNYVIKENVRNAEMSPRMQELLEGLNEPGDSRNPPEAPEWLDRELFYRGRQFYHKYLFCIFFSDLLSLLMMFSVSRVLRPLIYTERSDTPARALRRYVSTIMHIICWFTGDVWDPNDSAHSDVLSVRSIHNKSANTFNSSKHYDKLQSMSVKDKGHEEPKCPFSPAIRQDLQTQAKPGFSLESPENPPLYISQWDMAMTQYSFLGLMLSHPYRMGAWWVTETELEGLVHFWRGIGWLLGIEDKYNFCTGTAAETRELCLEMERLIMVPNLSVVDCNHEHMSSSLMEGISHMVPGLSYPAMFRFLADTLGLSVPTLSCRMDWGNAFRYWLMRFVFHILFIVPGIIFLFNKLLRLALKFIQDKYPEWFPKARTSDSTVNTSDDHT